MNPTGPPTGVFFPAELETLNLLRSASPLPKTFGWFGGQVNVYLKI